MIHIIYTEVGVIDVLDDIVEFAYETSAVSIRKNFGVVSGELRVDEKHTGM